MGIRLVANVYETQGNGTRTESDAFGEIQVRRLEWMLVLQRNMILNFRLGSSGQVLGCPD